MRIGVADCGFGPLAVAAFIFHFSKVLQQMDDGRHSVVSPLSEN
jgi:hypothetical protein